MPNLSQIIDVLITRATRGVSQVGFGTPMILGSTAGRMGSDVRRRYSDLDGVGVDFLSSDPEYKAAAAIFAQDQFPPEIVIGVRGALVAQVATASVVQVLNSHLYRLVLNGVNADYTSDGSATGSEIQAGLVAAINALSGTATASPGAGTSVTVTANTAGVSFALTSPTPADLTVAATTANHGVADDIAAVQAVDDDWYMLILTSRDKNDILVAAAFIETQLKMFSACSADSDVKASGSSDVMSLLKGHNYDRTFYVWSDDQATYPEAAWVGLTLPYDPGSENWKFRSVKGSVSSKLSTTEQSNVKGKNGNTYETYAGVSIFAEGKVASGEFIDVIRFIDWVKSRIQEGVFGLFVNTVKVSYTDIGVASIETQLRQVLEAGVKVGGFAEGSYIINAGKVRAQSGADRAARYFPDISWSATLAGAINKSKIRGLVSV